MLKSHFNITDNNNNDEQEEETVEQKKKTTESYHEELEGSLEAVLEEEILRPTTPPRPSGSTLSKSQVSMHLELLGKTADGDGYTYLKANLEGLGLSDITAIKCFKHLQFVNVSNNKLDLQSLQVVTELPFLVLIHADNNFLTSATLKRCKYLQVVILNNNQINSVHGVFQSELSTLEVGYNQIQKIHFDNRMPTIRCLDFHYNLIQEIPDQEFPMLDSLYLTGNKIKSLQGLDKFVNLRILHLRNNPIKLLDGFDATMSKLQYINLRNCKVSTLRQVKKLKVLPALETLVMKGCPYMGGTGQEDEEAAQEEESPETRVEMIAALPRLKRINKTYISPEERAEAKDLMTQWLEAGENDEEEEVEEELIPEETIND